MKNFSKRGIIILIIAVVIIAIAVPTSVYAYNNHEYNKYLNQALTDIKRDNFETAEISLNKALTYGSKHKDEITKKLALIDILKSSKESYDSAMKLLSDKKYLDAFTMFGKVAKEDDNRYSNSIDKAAECKNSFIKENLENAKNKAASQAYEEAIQYLDTIINFDKDNQDASKLKSDYQAAIQKQKDDDAAKKAADDAAKKAADEKAKQTAAKPQQPATTPSAPSAPSTGISSTVSDGNLIITDNGKSMVFQFQHYNVMNGGLQFRIFANYADIFKDGMNTSSFDFSAAFHFGGQTVTVKGKTSVGLADRKSTVPLDYIPDDNKGSVDISITYKGKVYTFTNAFSFDSKN